MLNLFETIKLQEERAEIYFFLYCAVYLIKECLCHHCMYNQLLYAHYQKRRYNHNVLFVTVDNELK